ncbi:tautomerase family protein (plasmid) [Rhizobium sp. CB3171]|uniref:tautomerase family protein n=1 Tax=Rhizobium sp. CB3171 TaxID=3039157 RepID=UPI0024B17AE2|nr:tautomerase family protein [Rhizobium sp. CB3171]WFU07209.1 tautomerase family protein [Rhizobium sp. CB3171]
MPHVNIKYFVTPLMDAAKASLAEAFTEVLTDNLGCASEAMSVSLRPVAPVDWLEQVFVPDISQRRAELIQISDYSRLAARAADRKEP